MRARARPGPWRPRRRPPPACTRQVEVYSGAIEGALESDTFSAVVVSTPLPKDVLFGLNEAARSKGIAFVMALNVGVTASIFSDFGP